MPVARAWDVHIHSCAATRLFGGLPLFERWGAVVAAYYQMLGEREADPRDFVTHASTTAKGRFLFPEPVLVAGAVREETKALAVAECLLREGVVTPERGAKLIATSRETHALFGGEYPFLHFVEFKLWDQLAFLRWLEAPDAQPEDFLWFGFERPTRARNPLVCHHTVNAVALTPKLALAEVADHIVHCLGRPSAPRLSPQVRCTQAGLDPAEAPNLMAFFADASRVDATFADLPAPTLAAFHPFLAGLERDARSGEVVFDKDARLRAPESVQGQFDAFLGRGRSKRSDTAKLDAYTQKHVARLRVRHLQLFGEDAAWAGSALWPLDVRIAACLQPPRPLALGELPTQDTLEFAMNVLPQQVWFCVKEEHKRWPRALRLSLADAELRVYYRDCFVPQRRALGGEWERAHVQLDETELGVTDFAEQQLFLTHLSNTLRVPAHYLLALLREDQDSAFVY